MLLQWQKDVADHSERSQRGTLKRSKTAGHAKLAAAQRLSGADRPAKARLGEAEGVGEGVEVMRYPNPKPVLDESACSLQYRVLAYNFLDALPLGKSALESRGVQLLHNPGVRKPAERGKGIRDLVGLDLMDTPAALSAIKGTFLIEQLDKSRDSTARKTEQVGNRLASLELTRVLRERLVRRKQREHDGSIDVLVTGCETSLWAGEQFASDLALVFPQLSVQSCSANKLLGLFGQDFALPTTGFVVNSQTFIESTIVLLISHTGGTFGTLGTANLLKGATPNLFVVTSEWDTQLARTVIAGKPGVHEDLSNMISKTLTNRARIFTTGVGDRPAEPCSVSLAAIHQLLTQILLQVMLGLHQTSGSEGLGGSSYSIADVRELIRLNDSSLATIAEMLDPTKPTHQELTKQGRRWAWHVLEGPVSWMMCAAYIAITVTIGATPLSAVVGVVADAAGYADGAGGVNVGAIDATASAAALAAVATSCAGAAIGNKTAACVAAELSYTTLIGATISRPWLAYVVGAVDSLIYAFLPFWTTSINRGWGRTDDRCRASFSCVLPLFCSLSTCPCLALARPHAFAVLLRLLQGRPWHHRVAGRSLVIGDVPWVAQSLEAFLSKLFALSYSIASLNVLSGNPTDHLVHRHTHRVVRGALVAVGRPDGRLNALASAESATCLSVSQASSIQNMNVTCESFTIGHNPSRMSLTQNDVFLPTLRPKFLSEWRLEQQLGEGGGAGKSSNALLGAMADMRRATDIKVSSGLDADLTARSFLKKQSVASGSDTGAKAGAAAAWFGAANTIDESGLRMRADGHETLNFSHEQQDAALGAATNLIGEHLLTDPKCAEMGDRELQNKQVLVQTLYESRMASLQRLLAFMVSE